MQACTLRRPRFLWSRRHLEEEAQLQAALVVQVVGAAHVAVHVPHAQGEALLRQPWQLGSRHRLPVPCLAICPVAGPHVPACVAGWEGLSS